MSWRNWGNVPQFSTTPTATDPSTATIVSEIITSTGPVAAEIYEVRWGVGANSTSVVWLLEHCTSSGLGSTAIVQQNVVMTGTNQTSEFVFTFRVTPGDRFRTRVLSTFTGIAASWIQIEAVT